MNRIALLGCVALVSFAVPALGESSFTVVLEPGIDTGRGTALLPLRVEDSLGRPLPVSPNEISVEIEGERVAVAQVGAFGGTLEPYRLAIVLDSYAFRGVESRMWVEALAEIAHTAEDPVEIYTLSGGLERFEVPESREETRDRLSRFLSSAREEPLWDDLLSAIGELSDPGDPARRVALLVSGGNEARESRHPVVTCIDAADSARVAVYAVVPSTDSPGREAGEARLGELTRRTGGGLFTQEGSGTGGLSEALRVIRGVQAVGLRDLKGDPPYRVTVTVGLAAAAPANGWIRTRRHVDVDGGLDLDLVPLLGGLVVALAAGGLLFHRFRPLGRVRTVSGAPPAEAPVTRSGLTLGGARGNDLVFEDSRVSRSHAVIRIQEGTVTLVDLRSANGTRVNGRRVKTAKLKSGDRIVLAEVIELVYESRFGFGPRR